MTVERVILAEPRGFCAGVEMSVKALIWLRSAFPSLDVYCYHGIVHNRVVISWFESRGVRFVDDLESISDAESTRVALMLSAHGTAPEIVRQARSRFPIVVDAACPLVTKVHHELRRRAGTDDLLVYLGEPHHDEAVGTLGASERAVSVVSSVADVQDLSPATGDVSLLTQTTLPYELHVAVTAALAERFRRVWTPEKDDLCFATTNRQAAVRQLSRLADWVLVVGSDESSNTKSLVAVAQAAGARHVSRVNHPAELPPGLGGTVGITAGASAPESLVEEICAGLPGDPVYETIVTLDEDEYFPPPRDLRALEGNNPELNSSYRLADDRNISAADLMRDL